MFTLEGKRALVCGSTQGIGKACAIELARYGAEVTLVARNEESLKVVCGELDTAKGQFHDTLAVDFSDWQAVRDKAAAYISTNGPVQILLNNTGGPAAGPAIEADPEAFEAAFKQHILCNQALVQTVVPGMKQANYGRIINIISSSVIMPIKGLGVSNTIRGAVANWGKTLASELAPAGITVNNILPGFIDTARLGSLITGRAKRLNQSEAETKKQMEATVAMGRFGEPAEIGRVVAFLASPAASYISGVNLPVDGGRLAAS